MAGLAACGPARPAVLAARWRALADRTPEDDSASYTAGGGTLHVAASSRFYGYASGVHRDATNYGWAWTTGWNQQLPQSPGAQVVAANVLGQSSDDVLVLAPATSTLSRYTLSAAGQLTPAGSQTLAGSGSLVAGDFRGVGHADLGLVDVAAGTLRLFSGNGRGGFTPAAAVHLGVRGGQWVAGDFDGDGRADLCNYSRSGLTVLFSDGQGRFGRGMHSVWPGADGSGTLVAAPFAQNHRADLALYGGAGLAAGFEFRLGRGDGTFGPRADEMGTPAQTHLWALYSWGGGTGLPLAGHLGASIPSIALWEPSGGLLTVQQASITNAYNYSVCLMPVGNGYRLWYGGRWQTLNTSGTPRTGWDGDHVLSASSPDGLRWYRRMDAPEMYQGKELGQTGWWTNNYLQPQVIRVGDVYHMFWQAEVNPGQPVDTGQIATAAADRIGLSTSSDGRHWQRMTTRGVVVGLDQPAATKLGDEETLYVANDPDHLPWWLYVYYMLDGHPQGYFRLRSADPTTFDWSAREQVTGFSQLGNGCAYADGAPGGRVYLRITFAPGPTGRTYPTLQFSRDGLTWGFGQAQAPTASGAAAPLWETVANATSPGLVLATTQNNRTNRNVYFLGLSSVDGTGQLESTGPGSWRALYAATTSNGPTVPDIWHSQIGVGELTLKLT